MIAFKQSLMFFLNFCWFYFKKGNHVCLKENAVPIWHFFFNGTEMSWCRTVFFNGCRTVLFPLVLPANLLSAVNSIIERRCATFFVICLCFCILKSMFTSYHALRKTYLQSYLLKMWWYACWVSITSEKTFLTCSLISCKFFFLCSQPLERRQAHTEGCRDIKWARNQSTLLATSGRPGRQIKVFSTRHHQVNYQQYLL